MRDAGYGIRDTASPHSGKRPLGGDAADVAGYGMRDAGYGMIKIKIRIKTPDTRVTGRLRDRVSVLSVSSVVVFEDEDEDDTRPSTCNLQPSTFNLQPATFNP